jgi:PAS domain S-box-containing protein
LSGIRDVINGVIPYFRAEYACDTPTRPHWFELIATPCSQRGGAVLRHSEITELRKTRDEYAMILSSARGILWRANLPDFQTTFTSKHVEAILGYPVQAWLEPGFWIDRIHPEDREWVLAFTGREAQKGRNHEFEYRMISAAGQTIWLRNIVNVVVEHCRPKEVVGISTDISERKRAEEAARSVSSIISLSSSERAAAFLID